MMRLSQNVIDEAQALVDAGKFKEADDFFRPYTRAPGAGWFREVCELENAIVDGLIEMESTAPAGRLVSGRG